MEYLIIVLSLALLVYLLNFYINWKAYGKKEKSEKILEEKRKAASAKGLLVQCPLCSSDLLPGEDLYSKVYRPMNVPDQRCTISGCPHCYPQNNSNKKRICPVCHKEVPVENGYLVARLFNKSEGKKHVIVTGCSECCNVKN